MVCASGARLFCSRAGARARSLLFVLLVAASRARARSAALTGWRRRGGARQQSPQVSGGLLCACTRHLTGSHVPLSRSALSIVRSHWTLDCSHEMDSTPHWSAPPLLVDLSLNSTTKQRPQDYRQISLVDMVYQMLILINNLSLVPK